MKRYVKEFANEFLNVRNYPQRDKDRILRIIKCCERGVITSVEAISLIASIHNTESEAI